MFDVICWKWKSPAGYRSQFKAENVNILHNMVTRHLHIPFRFSCITDDPAGINSGIRIIPLWDDYATIPNPNSNKNPSCYRRLKAFSSEAKELIGDRILSIDLDCVILKDITHLVDRDDDFVCWGDTAKGTHYNGGLWLLRAGTRTQVWDTFDPIKSPITTKQRKIIGTDQAWISYVLDGQDPKWGVEHGIYSYRNHIQNNTRKPLPDNACIIMFHGHLDPWSVGVMDRHQWVRDNYR